MLHTSLSASASESLQQKSSEIEEKNEDEELSSSPFRIVIDAGSTGSRLHMFELVKTSSSSTECLRRGSSKAWTPLSAFAAVDGDGDVSLNATHVAHHMLPLFDYASIIIPQQYHSTTPVRIAATAGMRLLPLDEQTRVYDALYKGLLEQVESGRFTFTDLSRVHVMTLNGEREGFYGAVAANYLKGVVDAELRVILVPNEDDSNDQGICTNKFGMCEQNAQDIMFRVPNKKHNEAIPDDDEGLCTNKFGMCEQDAEDIIFGPSHHYISNQQNVHDVKRHGVLGALDMGGSSTQIVYRHTTNSRERHDRDNTLGANESVEGDRGTTEDEEYDVPSHLNDEEFFSTSYLSFGADQFRERLWDLWILDAKTDSADNSNYDENNPLVIFNPCSFVGYQMIYKGYNLLGTGNAVLCAEQINRLIPHQHNDPNDAIDLDELYDENIESQRSKEKQQQRKVKIVGGVEHPPIRGKFYGMSLYFFTLDCLRELSDTNHAIHISWPTPSIEELTHALVGFCARSWKGDLEEVQHEAHEHTRAEVLPHRCIEAVYMVTLLRDGFGFHPQSRDITFTQWVEGNEVEWSLGMVLAEFAAAKGERQKDHDTNESII